MVLNGVWHEQLSQLRWKVVRAMTPRRLVRAQGLRFTLQCDNWITQRRFETYNVKEPETLDWIDAWVKGGDTLIDVGANIGVYTVYAALRHPGIRVIAVEPEYGNLHLLRDNVVANGLQDQVEIYSVAFSSRSGPSFLHVQDFTPGAALHAESPNRLTRTIMGRPVVGREGVWVLTLDSFCEQTGLQPTGLKIDVDGTEAEILKGGGRTLGSSTLRSVIIEPPPDEPGRRACEVLLHQAGLRLHWRDPLGQSSNEVWVR